MATHLINIAMNFDDSDVIERVKDEAIEQVKEDIIKTVEEIIGSPLGSWSYNWKQFVTDITNKKMDEYKEEIVENVSNKLVDKIYRTKILKNAVEKTIADNM